MAQGDWTEFDDDLDSSILKREPTGGLTPPPGGGTYVFAFNSLEQAEGAAGLYVDLANFNPIASAKGCQVTGALRKGPGSATGYSAFLVALARATSVNDNAYLIGFEGSDPARIKVYKGPIVNGIPSTDPESGGVTLMASDESFDIDEWVHIRVDVIVQPSGDVLIKVFKNDLSSHNVDSPSWVPLAGCEEFVDDILGINSGSLPYDGGYVGFGCEVNGVSKRAQFDYLTVTRQT